MDGNQNIIVKCSSGFNINTKSADITITQNISGIYTPNSSNGIAQFFINFDTQICMTATTLENNISSTFGTFTLDKTPNKYTFNFNPKSNIDNELLVIEFCVKAVDLASNINTLEEQSILIDWSNLN